MTSLTIGPTRASKLWHLWLVGGLNALWTAFGCFDYTMTVTRGEAWLRQAGLNDAQVALFNAMPAWMTGAWALGVWGGLVGSLLLLARRRWAVWALTVSAVAAIAGQTATLTDAEARAAMGGQVGMAVVVMVVAVLVAVYAWAMARRGVLR